MAEQVVNIRDRIEKMRNQINDKPESQLENVKNENIDRNTSIKEENKKSDSINTSLIKNVEKFKEEPKTHVVSERNDNQDKKKNIGHFNETANKENHKKERSNFQENITNQKSYRDYQVKNLVDEDQKPFLDNKSQAFPQFSLNVNNPISWKLMLLIMLMQLLTNVMLVVVLYLK